MDKEQSKGIIKTTLTHRVIVLPRFFEKMFKFILQISHSPKSVSFFLRYIGSEIEPLTEILLCSDERIFFDWYIAIIGQHQGIQEAIF